MTPDPSTGRAGHLFRVLLAGATLLALLASAQHWAVMQVTAEDPTWRTLGHALSREIPFWYLWVAMAPAVLVGLRRVPLRKGRLAVAVPAHLLLALAVIAVHSAGLLAGHRLLGFPTPEGPFWQVYRSGILFRITTGMLGYLALFGAVLAWDYYQRFRERELAAAALTSQLAGARLEALRMQLNPHFLFNTLNTIAMLMRSGERGRAVSMLAGLSELLRYVLEEAPPQEVPLRLELAFIRRYLEIEQERFPDRLRVEFDVEEVAEDVAVPNLVLQPLVENAVRHGVAQRATAGRIRITAGRDGTFLVLSVEDDGPGHTLPEHEDNVTPASGIPLSAGGIGLRNTRDRLRQLYGDRGRLDLANRPGGGFVARVRLPWHAGSPRQQELEAEAVG